MKRNPSAAEHPFGVFAKLEAMICVLGALLIVLMPLVGRLYTAVDGGGPSSIVLRALASVILLLPPTMLMGATLPAISRYVEATREGVAWLGFFYSGNIYLAGVGFNYNIGTQIRDRMLGYRQFPTDLFRGHASSIDSLRSLMMDGF